MNLNASITQRLTRTADGKGRRAALEIMRVNRIVAKLIDENRVSDCFQVIRTRDAGMQMMDQALADLVRDGQITFAEATIYCDDVYALKRYVEGMGASGDAGAILSA